MLIFTNDANVSVFVALKQKGQVYQRCDKGSDRIGAL